MSWKECYHSALDLKRRFESHCNESHWTSSNSDGGEVKLSKFDVPTFDGNLLSWKSFWEEFWYHRTQSLHAFSLRET